MKKIHSIRTQKTEQAIEAEFAQIEQRQNKMLLESMWTQLADSGLKTSIMYRWQIWRTKVKQVKRNEYSDPRLYQNALDELKSQQPPLIYADMMEPVIAPVVLIRIDRLDQCVRSILFAADALNSLSSARLQRKAPFWFADLSEALATSSTVEDSLEIFYGFIDNGY